MTHTPGPWIADGELIKRDCAALGNTNVKIAKVSQRNLNTDGNARLIAAAPELLEALREYVERHEADSETSPIGCPEYDKAIAAIAKAEGR